MMNAKRNLRRAATVWFAAVVLLLCTGCPNQQAVSRKVVVFNATPWAIEAIGENTVIQNPDGDGYVVSLRPLVENYLSSPLAPYHLSTIRDISRSPLHPFFIRMTEEELNLGIADTYVLGLNLDLDEGDVYVVVAPHNEENPQFPFHATVYGRDWQEIAKQAPEGPEAIQFIPIPHDEESSKASILVREYRIH